MKRILPFIFLPLCAFAQNSVVPVLNVLIPDVENDTDDDQRSVVLADHFGTEEIADNAVRLTAEWTLINGTPGTTNFDFLLFRNITPVTKTNFLGYVNRGDYENMVVHRLVRNFVIQGGGFTFIDGETSPVYESVPTQPKIVNEFGVSNTLATISMAKLGGDPDSATSQWFVSTSANSDNLDLQNGGFTVFGRVSKETFPNVMALNNGDVVVPYNIDNGGVFSAVPLVSGTTGATFTANRFFRFSSVTEVPVSAGQAGTNTDLTYSIVSQSGDGMVTASIVDGELVLDFMTPLGNGTDTIVVQAEDSVGNQVVDTFQVVSVEKIVTYEDWRDGQFSGADLLDDAISGPLADPNSDGVTNFGLYVLGLPATGDQRQKVAAPTLNLDASNTVLTFDVAAGRNEVEFVLEESANLDDWNLVTGLTMTVQEGVERDLVSFSVAETPASKTSVFYRVRFNHGSL